MLVDDDLVRCYIRGGDHDPKESKWTRGVYRGQFKAAGTKQHCAMKKKRAGKK